MSGYYIKRKSADRREWARILEREFSTSYMDDGCFKGWISNLKLIKVREPLIKMMGQNKVNVVDNNYTWLGMYPEGKNYALTTMYNSRMEIVQWYVDITLFNGVSDDGMPFFDDLFLDIVLLPDSEIFVLDKDELDGALERKNITKAEYNLAVNEVERILSSDMINVKKLTDLCNRYKV